MGISVAQFCSYDLGLFIRGFLPCRGALPPQWSRDQPGGSEKVLGGPVSPIVGETSLTSAVPDQGSLSTLAGRLPAVLCTLRSFLLFKPGPSLFLTCQSSDRSLLLTHQGARAGLAKTSQGATGRYKGGEPGPGPQICWGGER